MNDRNNTSQKPFTYADMSIARAVLKAAKRDYECPEVQADYERWKKERAVQAAKNEVK